jgi:peptidoglycan/LPS O-acetylase OafA/YrhL
MAAATWHFPGPSRARLPRVPFAAVVALALAGVAVTVLFELLPFPKLRRVGEQDLFTGLAAAAFFVYGTACIEEGTPSRLIDFLSSRVMAWMGSFSYSIYLLHAPVLTFLYLKVIDQNLPPLLQLAELILVAVPGTLLFAYIFYLLIERHFIPDPARKAGA